MHVIKRHFRDHQNNLEAFLLLVGLYIEYRISNFRYWLSNLESLWTFVH